MKERKGEDRIPTAEDLPSSGKRVPAILFRTEGGREPVRDWLKALPYADDTC